MNGWIAVQPHIVGNPSAGYETTYEWNGALHRTRELAISVGFKEFGSDDFNVGRIQNDKLTWIGWMDEEHPAEDRDLVAKYLGLAS